MRRISCIQDARRLSERSHGFGDSVKASVQTVPNLLRERFSHLKLKGQPIEVTVAASDEDVTDFFQSLSIIDQALEQSRVTQKDLTRCEQLGDFMTRHCRQRQYMFHFSLKNAR